MKQFFIIIGFGLLLFLILHSLSWLIAFMIGAFFVVYLVSIIASLHQVFRALFTFMASSEEVETFMLNDD